MAWKGLRAFQETVEQQQADSLTTRYRSVFGTDTGLMVLADMLRDMGVMQDLDPRDPVSNALRNYAETVLINKIGKTTFTAAIGKMLEDEPY